jgi:hypothetical protein
MDLGEVVESNYSHHPVSASRFYYKTKFRADPPLLNKEGKQLISAFLEVILDVAEFLNMGGPFIHQIGFGCACLKLFPARRTMLF